MESKATMLLNLSKQQRQTVLKALKPEVLTPASHRSRASLCERRGLLVLEIEAEDSVALRAAVNSYLRWINSILGVFETLKAQR